jgi:Ni/Co efflux regulator RcnB
LRKVACIDLPGIALAPCIAGKPPTTSEGVKMKKNRMVAALLCATLGLGASLSFAQPAPGGPEHHDDHGGPAPHGAPGDHGGPGGHGPSIGGHDQPHPPEHADVPPHHPDWRKGERLQSDYRNRQYVVDDWREHKLHQPPRGYQWVGVGGDYLLVAVTSGIIAQVVFSQ